MRPTILTLLLLFAPAWSASAQARSPTWPRAPEVVFPRAMHSTDGPDPRPLPFPRGDTYWKEGGIIGAVVLGILGAVLVDGLCGDDSQSEHCGTKAVGGGVVGAAVGFTVGALIGGHFPKSR